MDPNASLEINRKGFNPVLVAVFLIVYSALLLVVGITSTVVVVGRTKTPAVSKAGLLSRLSNPTDSLYANLQGTIRGRIVKIDADKAYFQSEKGGKAIFDISPQVAVIELEQGKVLSLGNSIDKIRLNGDCVIKITGFGNGYRIYLITYVKDSPLFYPQEIIKQSSGSANLKSTSVDK